MPVTELPQLRLSILGPSAITIGDEPLSISRQQYRALLYRLGAEEGPVARDHLTFLFWPDMADYHARRNLTQLISHVRRELPDPDLLLTSKEHVQLDPLRVRSDAVEFDRLCKLGDEASLRQAVTLYRSTLLTGLSLPDHPEFEAWLSSERFRFEINLLEALRVLAKHNRERGRFREAAALAERYLSIDELAEEVHRQLMETYAAAGDRSAAIRQYERCLEVLERELGVAPLPETEAAYQAILRGAPAAPPAATTNAPAAAPAYKLAWGVQPRSGMPLVGRDDLLRELAATFARVHAGEGQVVLLRGEPGIGKSRLMQEFATHVQAQALVLAAACYPSTRSIPYQPVIEALRPVLESTSLGSTIVRSVAAAWLSEASILLPELRQLSPGLAPPESTGPQPARARLFEALHQIFLALTSESFPVMLCLDDMQWADTTTLDWLAYLARHILQRPFLLIGTCRDEEAAALSGLLRDLRRTGFRPEVKIEGLARESVSELLLHLQVADARAMTARLHDVTGGNPFFLLETVSELLESGLDAATAVDRTPLPISENVRAAVQRRVERLLPLSRQVLEAGAVAETEFAFDFIRKTAGRSELETVDALDELVTRTLLVHERDSFRFRHELIRTVIYQGLSPWRRRILHRRVAEALEEEMSGQTEAVAAQLARHFQTGGDIAKAILYWQQAGDAAARLYAHVEAVDCYRRGLELAQESESLEHLSALFSSLGRVLELDSQFDQALATYGKMEATAVATGSRTMELQALVAQATLYSTYNPRQDLTLGETVSTRALALAKELANETAEAKILGSLAILYSYALRWEEAISCGQRSIAIARRCDLPEQLALSLNDLASHCYTVIGQLSPASEMLSEARALWQQLGNLPMLADCLATAAEVDAWAGHYARSLRDGREALHISRSIDNLWGQSYSQYRWGAVYWDRGRIDLALATIEDSLHLAQRAGFVVPLVLTHADAAMLYAELGDVEPALEQVTHALHYGEKQGRVFLPYALGALALVAIEQRDISRAEAILTRAESDFGAAMNNVYYAPDLVARAMLSLQQADYARAIEDARRLGSHSMTALRPTAYLIEAQAWQGLGKIDTALACVGQARQAAKTIGSRRTLWRILYLHSELEPDAGKAARARTQARRIVCAMAYYIPHADLRAKFLSTPAVRRVLDAQPVIESS